MREIESGRVESISFSVTEEATFVRRAVAVMVTVPRPRKDTLPLEDTRATEESDEAQVTRWDASAGSTWAVSDTDLVFARSNVSASS